MRQKATYATVLRVSGAVGEAVAEQRILEAQRNGAFDNLANDGKPLELGRPMSMEQRL